MEKQIFIPYSSVPQWIRSGLNVPIKENIDSLYWCGLVNQILGAKANCKEIISVEYVDEINLMDEIRKGYIITYLESEMIASKDDLKSAFAQGCFCGREKCGTFTDWFNENF